MRRSELAALLLLGVVWGGSYLFIRVAVPELGPFPLMAARVLLAAAILATLPAVRRGIPGLRRHPGHLLVLGAANAAIPFSLIAAAELHITASLAAILTATVPMFSTLVNAAWKRERVGLTQSCGLLLGIVGVAALVGWSPVPATREVALSIAAMLLASFGYAFATVYAKQRLSDVAPPSLALGQQLAAAAWLAVPAALTVPQVPPSRPALLSVLALATVSTALAYLLYFHLIERIGPTRTSTVTYLIPVFGSAWGVLFLDETISVGMVAGLVCILLSVAFVNGIRLPGGSRRPAPAARLLQASAPAGGRPVTPPRGPDGSAPGASPGAAGSRGGSRR